MKPRMTIRLTAGLISIAVVLSASGASHAEPPAGRLLASQCAQCHGTDGNSVTDLEKLAGADAEDMLNELLDMKYSGDTDDIMIRQAKGYTDAQLRAIAEYFASLPSANDD